MAFLYTSLAIVNAELSIHPRLANRWNALTVPKQEALITYGERAIEAVNWLGRKVSNSQVAQFPRTLVAYAETYEAYYSVDDSVKDQLALDEAVIPANLVLAVTDWIIDYLDSDAFFKFTQMQLVGVDQFSAGEVSFSFHGKKWSKPLTPNSYKRVNYLTLGFWTQGNPVLTRL